MDNKRIKAYIKNVLENTPADWLKLTTHRLDIYNEKLAKVEFLTHLEQLFSEDNFEKAALGELPTAYDYIRLGHPLSCLLEWVIAKSNSIQANNVISFASQTIAIMAVLRKNALLNKATQIVYETNLPSCFDTEILRNVYGYSFEVLKLQKGNTIPDFNGSTIFVSNENNLFDINIDEQVDFLVKVDQRYGSIIFINGAKNESYISEIQHVRRRETIAMTPADCFSLLSELIGEVNQNSISEDYTNKLKVENIIKEITNAYTKPLIASSGLSIQYAIMMGLIHHAQENHNGKNIKIVVPPNCYGGTNDQARRVAAVIEHVEIVDLPVDGGNDMVQSIESVLTQIANEDAVPYIIAEIPTNPRVEVPDLDALKNVLSKERHTQNGSVAVEPVFILDQTFCPNVDFLGSEGILSSVKTISYSSGSKFPSGGLCNAGYCVGNEKTSSLMEKIESHLNVCDNEATYLQYEILANQMPSMNQRIQDAYDNTKSFVGFIKEKLPDAKINFVSEELAKEGFTPSVFSLDLPTKGDTPEEKESYKRALNHKLIKLMITQIPNESKHCVSYGQLKGCYWTIPATSTQGTTKEGDKDYIARVALSPNMDLELHKKIFLEFVNDI